MVSVRIGALDRKLLRDIWHLRGQVLAVTAVVMCGIAVFLTMRGMVESLVDTRDRYYAEYRFADVFANVKRAPESVAARIAAMPGVRAVETGITLEVMLDVPDLAEPATAQLISLPDGGSPRLNRLHLRSGRTVAAGARDEVLASEAFARANRLEPGATITAVINGRRERLVIVGIAISPEFIYTLRPASGLPDDRRYGILWMSRAALENAYDMDGAFNRVALGLEPGASERDVITALDRLLERYGAIGAYGRGEHLSDKVIRDEIRQDSIYGGVISAIFLGVAAFIVHIVLSRLVAIQRDQLGVIKAFGYGNRAIAAHFVKLALLVVVSGTLLGIPVAAWLGEGLAAIYRDFFHFPHYEWQLSARGLAMSVAISAASAFTGAYVAVLGAIRLPPAEAMRPPTPARFRPGWIERAGFQRWLSMTERMVVRNLERRPWKAALSVLGLALAVAIIVVGRYGIDALDRIIDVQFRATLKDDITIELNNPRAAAAIEAIAQLPGVIRAEPFRAVPVRLRAGHREKRTAVIGFAAQGNLHALVDLDYRATPMPDEGIVLSTKLAGQLGLAIGDRFMVELLEGARRSEAVVLAATVDDLVGLGAYMSLPALNRLMHEPAETLSGAYLTVDPAARERLYRRLKEMPMVRGVSVKESMLANFRDVIARSLLVQTIANIVFASVIAFGVVYNSVRIALSERGNELASLRVLGFTHREVAAMLLGEQLVLVLVAIPLGFAVGAGICAMLVMALDAQETMRLPLVFSGRTFAFAFVIVATAAMLSAFAIWRRLRGLDLIAVLKTRE
ncbi:MAG TPA: ABC transporter permease [Rhodocyclaceae bacterium]|nr:ABC transporter permease [Rhodocyclaceae bacterium]